MPHMRQVRLFLSLGECYGAADFRTQSTPDALQYRVDRLECEPSPKKVRPIGSTPRSGAPRIAMREVTLSPDWSPL